MKRTSTKIIAGLLFSFALLIVSPFSQAGLVKGIYLSQTTLEDTRYLYYLISRAKKIRY